MGRECRGGVGGLGLGARSGLVKVQAIQAQVGAIRGGGVLIWCELVCGSGKEDWREPCDLGWGLDVCGVDRVGHAPDVYPVRLVTLCAKSYQVRHVIVCALKRRL